MQVKVAVVGGAADGLELTLEHFPITLGREGDGALPIHDRWASRHHCQLFECSGELHVRDLGSKHGTIVNHAPIDECRLREGDRLMVGLTALVIQQIDAQGADSDVLVDRGSGVGA
jgi:pSer/pThr/pTyr-binding forkhead associated (FHA) protein